MSSGSIRQWLQRLSMACCLCLPVVARAQGAEEPTPAQIRAAAEAFDRGREAYAAQDYVTAAEAFERADSQAPSPTALEYALRARDKAGQLDRAATLAALAQRRHPDEKNLAKLAPQVLERVRSQVHEVSVQCTEPCELAVGGKIVHGAPDTERRLFLAPGPHEVRAGFGNDRGDSRTLEATAGGQSEIAFVAPAEPVPVETPQPAVAERPGPTPEDPPPAEAKARPSTGWSTTPFWVGVGLTSVGTIATIWSGVHTLNNPGEERIKDECSDTNCELYQEGLSNQRRTNVLLGVTAGLGVATALVGALLTDWGGPEANENEMTTRKRNPRRAERSRIEPWLGLGQGTMLGATGRF